MTLILLYKSDNNMMVIADTLFRSRDRIGTEIGPKIFTSSIRLSTYGEAGPPIACPDIGFAFAGHTAAGQVTHAIASAGLRDLHQGKDEGNGCPSIEDIARFFGRCGKSVVGEMRLHHPTGDYSFESVIFGWQGEQAVAWQVDVSLDSEERPTSIIDRMNFEEFGLFAIGQGSDAIQAFLSDSAASGIRPNGFDVMRFVMNDGAFPGVGGRIQAACASPAGVKLKPVLIVSDDGNATGGYMGTNLQHLGTVGGFVPLSGTPIIVPTR